MKIFLFFHVRKSKFWNIHRWVLKFYISSFQQFLKVLSKLSERMTPLLFTNELISHNLLIFRPRVEWTNPSKWVTLSSRSFKGYWMKDDHHECHFWYWSLHWKFNYVPLFQQLNFESLQDFSIKIHLSWPFKFCWKIHEALQWCFNVQTKFEMNFWVFPTLQNMFIINSWQKIEEAKTSGWLVTEKFQKSFQATKWKKKQWKTFST